jgi:hypothetical protein
MSPAPTELHETLAALLRGEPRPWSAVGVDAATFLAACAAEALGPLLWHCLHDGPTLAGWPASLRDALAETARAAAATELLVQRELARVLAALAAQGARPLLLKGTALAYGTYAHPGLRPRSDTDLLVRGSDLPLVRRVMDGLGYGAALQCDGDLLFRQFELNRTDDLGLKHVLDFHWAISTQAVFASLLTYDELWSRSTSLPALGQYAVGPGVIDALLLALIHPVMHHRNEERLLWTYDVHLLARGLDAAQYAELVERAQAKRIAAICARGLERARDWLATPVPEDVLDRLNTMPQSDQPTASYLTPGRAWLDETSASLRGLGSWRERLRLVKEIAFPKPAYMLRAYGMTSARWSKALLPALYAHRGVRGVARVLMRRK